MSALRARRSARCRTLQACAAVGLLALGCASFDIRSDYDRQIDFTRYHGFAWMDPPLREPKELPEAVSAQEVLLNNSLFDKRLRAAVARELVARGLQPADEGSADLLLRYRVGVDERTEIVGGTIGTGVYYGPYPYYVAPGLDTYWSSRNVRDGILILDMVDAQSGQLVWRGWAVGRSPDGYFRETEVERAVQGLMARFPPSPEGD